MMDPKVANPREHTMMVLLPVVLEKQATAAKPMKEPKKGRPAIKSRRDSSWHKKGPKSVAMDCIPSSFLTKY
jgi:hypothetical protein